ncbi:VWA domain-containing protein [candidate division WOR-3 bacterium]|nr:VWA domain-containing protein [candidate division WOR-3 bacterium]
MRFAHPWFFLLLAPVPAFAWWMLVKRRASIRYSDLSFLSGASNPGPLLRAIPVALYALALAMMVVALARPQKGRRYEEVETRGIDMMLCIDVSGSMQAEDFAPKNRLHVAKERAKEFIAKRAGDRIGLVVFAAASLTQCPLTHDKNILNDLIDRLDFGMLEDGTAIGMGLGSATARLRKSEARERVVILLTDGVNNAGDIDPLTAAQAAAGFGIKVYTIGVGSRGEVPFPVQDPVFGRRYARVKIDIDTGVLDRIAEITGGRSFLATDAEGLKLVYDEIDRMEPTTFKVKQHTVYSERAGVFLLLAVVFLAAGALVAGLLLRRLP